MPVKLFVAQMQGVTKDDWREKDFNYSIYISLSNKL